MEIIRIMPQGICGGVRNALNQIFATINNEDIPKPIYIFGALVHNQHVIKRLEKNFILLDDNNDAYKTIDSIETGTIIFSAHGTDPKIIDYAKKKLFVLDLVCPKVKEIHQLVLDKLQNNYTIIYLGKKGHKETKAVLSLNSDIILMEKIEDLKNIPLTNKKIFATNQTTLEYTLTESFYQKLKKISPTSEIGDKICEAAKSRQKALNNYPGLDLVYVAGDNMSSNAVSLLKFAKQIFPKALLISSKEDINLNDLNKDYRIGVTSGASVPDYIVDEIIEYLTIF
ncbi:MAG: 4-hydroxy-3-methylbut-2-enyl diphosphate reductase [Erysipelotrichales bacterium]|nr:4-hydroxy-3-methylbut-2-enyl diphosphate reductase [Erysipelotrichales bacterium]